jgi:cytochrome c oxidase subunit 1
MTLYSAVYVLWPLLTNNTKLFSSKMTWIHFWMYLIGGIGMGAFGGMAGLSGMLRRHLYTGGEFHMFTVLSAICGTLVLVAWLIFLLNIVLSVGVKGLIGIFLPSHDKTDSYGLEPEDIAEESKA